jgi:hypothetical protein
VRVLSVVTLVVCLAAVRGVSQTIVQTRSPQGSSSDLTNPIAALSASDPVDRAFAACRIAESRQDAAAAVTALVRTLPDAATIDPVFCARDEFGAVTMLLSRKSAPGLEAARALASLGEAGMNALLTAARSADAATKRHAVHGLTYLRNARTTGVFLAVAADPDPQVRRDAAVGLGRVREPAAVEALLRQLGDRDADVREAAARSLGRAVRRR